MTHRHGTAEGLGLGGGTADVWEGARLDVDADGLRLGGGTADVWEGARLDEGADGLGLGGGTADVWEGARLDEGADGCAGEGRPERTARLTDALGRAALRTFGRAHGWTRARLADEGGRKGAVRRKFVARSSLAARSFLARSNGHHTQRPPHTRQREITRDFLC